MNKKFEIGLFGLNSNSGIAMTKSKKRWKANWEDIKKVIDHGLKNTKEDIDLDEFRRVQGILDESRQQSFAEAYPEWRKYA